MAEYASPVDPKLTDEAKRRLQAARTEKGQFLSDITEAQQFCIPQRVPPTNTASTAVNSRSNTAAENFTSLGEVVLADFSTQIAYTYAPEHTPFASEKLTSAVPDNYEADAKVAIENDEAAVFEAIAASNFYDAFKQGCKDLGISAFGMAIEDPGRGEPFRCQVIPVSGLLMLRAPTGGIGVRAWEEAFAVQDIIELFPDITLPKKVLEKKGRKSATVKKTHCCWRDYSKPGVLAWHCITLLDDEAIEYSHYDGFGSAPILTCRWDPDAPFAWGNGCAIKALPDLRALDECEYLALKGIAKAADPPVAYDDDGVINLEGGIANGTLIPRMANSKIDVIETANPNSISEMEAKISKIEATIRRHFFVDEPRQEGLTPPTLGQWLDESMRTQRRLGAPASSIWTEFLQEVFQRFRYLLAKRGAVSPQLKVGGKAIALRAVNPLQRAAEMEEAAASLRTLQSVVATWGPAILPIAFKTGETLHKLVEQSHASGLVLNDINSINKALQDEATMARVGQAATAVGQSGVLPLLAANKQGVPQ